MELACVARLPGKPHCPEAIHRLEGQRLLVRIPHVGARVVSLSHEELIELYEIRWRGRLGVAENWMRYMRTN